LESDTENAQLTLDNLAELQINLDEITEKLQNDGVAAFAKSFDTLMGAIETKLDQL